MPSYKTFTQPKINVEFSYNAFEQMVKEADAENKEQYKIVLKAYREMISLAAIVYGNRSKQHKYLLNNEPEKPISSERFLKKVRARWYKFQEAEEKRQYARERYQRSKESRARLSLMGLEAGIDYPYDSAITTENEILEILGDEFYPIDEALK